MKKIKAKIIERTIEGEGKVKVLKLGYKADLKVVDDKDDRWIIEGYASVFGNVDSYFEIVDKGAFNEWLDKWPADEKTGVKRFPKLVLGHNWERPLGPTLEVREDEIGLYVKGELLKDVQDARETYALIKAGATTDLSFGFRVRDDEYDPDTGYRHLKKIDIYEWSPVLVGANPSAIITGVKSVDGEDITEIPSESVINQEPEEVNEPEVETPTEIPSDDETETPTEEKPKDETETDEPATEEPEKGATVTAFNKDALEDAIVAGRDFLTALEALKQATDESESASSDTGVEQRKQDTSAMKLILRDARRADKINEKVILRAKGILKMK